MGTSMERFWQGSNIAPTRRSGAYQAFILDELRQFALVLNPEHGWVSELLNPNPMHLAHPVNTLTAWHRQHFRLGPLEAAPRMLTVRISQR